MKIRVTTQFKVNGDSNLDHHTDALLDALVALEGGDNSLSEADVNATIATRIVNVSVVVNAVNWESAETRAADVIRRALEMTGARVVTSRFVGPTPPESMQASIQSTELVPA